MSRISTRVYVNRTDIGQSLLNLWYVLFMSFLCLVSFSDIIEFQKTEIETCSSLFSFSDTQSDTRFYLLQLCRTHEQLTTDNNNQQQQNKDHDDGSQC
jgi:hypothetical protein